VNDSNLNALSHVVVVDNLASCARGLVRCGRTRMSLLPYETEQFTREQSFVVLRVVEHPPEFRGRYPHDVTLRHERVPTCTDLEEGALPW